MEMTITEALSEVNLIKKKILTKRAFIQSHLVRYEHLKDPLLESGGQRATIQAEFQSINDLSARLIKIRSGISRANLDNMITINSMSRSIMDWLTWKREIQKDAEVFAKTVVDAVTSNLKAHEQRPQLFKKDEGSDAILAKPLPQIDIKEWQKTYEENIDIMGRLDGQLSLKNATIVVSI